MDFDTALSVYLCFLAIVMVGAQIFFIFNLLGKYTGNGPASLALSHSVLLSSDDKGANDHNDENEDDLNED